MDFNDKTIDALITLDIKERVLAELIVWLKAKGLWEDAKKDIESLKHLASK